LGNFTLISAKSLKVKLRQKAWKRGEKGCGEDKGEGAVVWFVVLVEEEVGRWSEGWGGGVVGVGGEGRVWLGRGELNASFDKVGVGEGVRNWLASPKSRPLASMSSKTSASPSIGGSAAKPPALWSDVASGGKCATDFVGRLGSGGKTPNEAIGRLV